MVVELAHDLLRNPPDILLSDHHQMALLNQKLQHNNPLNPTMPIKTKV